MYFITLAIQLKNMEKVCCMFEIKIYVNENYDNDNLINFLKKLILSEDRLSIKKGWENGYHISLLGDVYTSDIKMITEVLENEIISNPSELYDEDIFKKKYRNVALLERKSEKLETIIQNKVVVLNNEHKFDNIEQFYLYLQTHKVFDRFYAHNYWEKNDVVKVSQDIFEFTNSLRELKIELSNGVLISNGFISHLSHFLGFMSSLSPSDKRKVFNAFKNKSKHDLKTISKDYKSGLTKGLNGIYNIVSMYIEDNKLNFFSPGNKDSYLKNINEASIYHKATFRDSNILELISKDPVLCTNRWVLNVLYEKLVLLNIKPIEKFYMNYLISLFRFKEEDLRGERYYES